MLSSYFFKGSWVVQLIVGMGLFLCSFFLEYQILLSFLTPPLLALFLTITLELGKVAAIVWHYYLERLSPMEYPRAVRITSYLFRIGLMILSLLCSQLYLSYHLDRPNLKKVKSSDIEMVKQNLKKKLDRLKAEFAREKDLMIERQEKEILTEAQQWDKRIEKLESLLLLEMDNVVNGVFKGPRYRELEKRLAQEKNNRQRIMKELRKRHTEELAKLNAFFANRIQEATEEGRRQQLQIENKDYAIDERANDRRIVAFLKVVKEVFNYSLLPLQFVFLFSFLLSSLMEAGIVLAFSTITIALAPVFQVYHQEAVEKEALWARVRGEANRDNVKHEAAVKKIYNAGKQTVEKAEAHFYKQCEGK